MPTAHKVIDGRPATAGARGRRAITFCDLLFWAHAAWHAGRDGGETLGDLRRACVAIADKVCSEAGQSFPAADSLPGGAPAAGPGTRPGAGGAWGSLTTRRAGAWRRVYPREPGTRSRPPVRDKPHCEALAGVADPVTTWPSEVDCLYPGGRVVLVPAMSSTQQSSAMQTVRFGGVRPGRPRPRRPLLPTVSFPKTRRAYTEPITLWQDRFGPGPEKSRPACRRCGSRSGEPSRTGSVPSCSRTRQEFGLRALPDPNSWRVRLRERAGGSQSIPPVPLGSRHLPTTPLTAARRFRAAPGRRPAGRGSCSAAPAATG
jgi:hypothetical protein